MATIFYHFHGCKIPTIDGRTIEVDGCALIHFTDHWKIVSLSVDGQPALCDRCRAKIKAWLLAHLAQPVSIAAIEHNEGLYRCR